MEADRLGPGSSTDPSLRAAFEQERNHLHSRMRITAATRGPEPDSHPGRLIAKAPSTFGSAGRTRATSIARYRKILYLESPRPGPPSANNTAEAVPIPHPAPVTAGFHLQPSILPGPSPNRAGPVNRGRIRLLLSRTPGAVALHPHGEVGYIPPRPENPWDMSTGNLPAFSFT